MHPLAVASRALGRIPTSAQHADSSTAAAHRGAGWHTSRTAIDTAHDHASRLHGSSHDCNPCNEPATSPSCSTQSPTNCIACLRPPVQAAPRPQLTHAHTDRRTERQPSPHDTSRNLLHPPHPHELTHPLSARLLANNSPAGTPNHSPPPHSESRHLRLTGGRTNPHSLTHMRELISPQPRSHRSHASRAYSHSTRLPS